MALDYVEAKQANHPGGYQSTRGLTRAILIMLGLHSLVSVLLCIDVEIMRNGMLAFGWLYDSMFWADWVQTGLFIATAVCFLCWMYRGYANLPALGSESILSSPKSAVTGWFIPFVNLVHGYRSTHNLYLESQRPAVLPSGFVLPTRAAIVGWWWGIYLARNFTLRIANSAFARDSVLFWFWSSALLDIAAAVLCMLVVYRVDKRQRDQHQDLVRRSEVPVPAASLR